MNKIVREDIDNIIKDGGDIWDKFANSRVLVTGASGLIGYYFIETLLRLNETRLKGKECKVIALARNWDKAIGRFNNMPCGSSFEFLLQDVCKPLDTEADYIIHTASQASPKHIANDPVGTMLPNIIGTNNLLSLAHKSKSKGFLFVSGGEVYGTGQTGELPTCESDYGSLDPISVRSCYAESKRAGESLCSCYKAQYGVPFVVARLAHTYGPGVTRDDSRVFADFVYNIVDKKNIQLKSDGSAIRSFCYISDAILGMFLVLLKGESGKAYNVCNENACTSIFNLATTLAQTFGIGIEVRSYKKDPYTKSCLDSFAVKSLGWSPKIGIKEGFERTVSSITI